VTDSRRDLGALGGRRQTGTATTVVGAEDIYGVAGRLRLQASRQGGPSPARTSTLGVYCSSIYLARTALQLPGVEVEEVAM